MHLVMRLSIDFHREMIYFQLLWWSQENRRLRPWDMISFSCRLCYSFQKHFTIVFKDEVYATLTFFQLFRNGGNHCGIFLHGFFCQYGA